MRSTRIRVTEAELTDIVPGTALHKRALDAFDEIDAGEPYRKYARDKLDKDGDLEFDEDAAVSLGADEGAYVMGWKWVDDEAAIAEGYLTHPDRVEEEAE